MRLFHKAHSSNLRARVHKSYAGFVFSVENMFANRVTVLQKFLSVKRDRNLH